MANKDKGLNRGGTQGQQGDLPSGGQDQGWHSPTGLGERNKQKQQGGMKAAPTGSV